MMTRRALSGQRRPLFAVGGDETYVINVGGQLYRVHTFTTVGAHELDVRRAIDIEYLIVAGGGGGGANGGAGGGSGGLLTNCGGMALSLGVGAQALVVGGGGQGAIGGGTLSQIATNGANSTAFSQTALGGGRGASGGNHAVFGVNLADNGGSGGGATAYGVNNTRSGGSGTAGQGYAGGNAQTNSNVGAASGGGGAGGAGASVILPTVNTGGIGGLGIDLSTWCGAGVGDSGWFASGGSGWLVTTAQPGGGGRDVNGARNGQAGTGGGGGGGSGGSGGSGIVIVRYRIY